MKPRNRIVDVILAVLVAACVLAFCTYYWSFAADFGEMFADMEDLPWHARVLFLSVPWWFVLAGAAFIGLALVVLERRRLGWRWLVASAIVAAIGMPLIVRSGISAIPVSESTLSDERAGMSVVSQRHRHDRDRPQSIGGLPRFAARAPPFIC